MDGIKFINEGQVCLQVDNVERTIVTFYKLLDRSEEFLPGCEGWEDIPVSQCKVVGLVSGKYLFSSLTKKCGLYHIAL
jgi:hypothetical protein